VGGSAIGCNTTNHPTVGKIAVIADLGQRQLNPRLGQSHEGDFDQRQAVA
jgi:hypothetical protein